LRLTANSLPAWACALACELAPRIQDLFSHAFWAAVGVSTSGAHIQCALYVAAYYSRNALTVQTGQAWEATLLETAAAAVHRGTELVWADRVELAASSSASTGSGLDREAAGGDWGGSIGLGGYGGYGSGAGCHLLETERAAARGVLSYSDAQLQRLSLRAARVLAHLEMVACLVGVETEEECVDRGEGGRELRNWSLGSGGRSVGVGARGVVRLVAVLVQTRNLWVWGVQKQVAERADAILRTLSTSRQACSSPSSSLSSPPATPPAAPPDATPTVREKRSPLPAADGWQRPRAGSGPKRDEPMLVDAEMLVRVLWGLCDDALRHEEGFGASYVKSPAKAEASGSNRPTGNAETWEWVQPRRGAAFLRASSLLWAGEQLGHGEGWGSERAAGGEKSGGVWLGAAAALLQQSTYDLKAVGARLLLLLLHRADRTDVRWNETLVVSSLEGCLHNPHVPLLQAALPALVLAVTTIDGDAAAPGGPLGGGVGPKRVLQLLLDQGLRESTPTLRCLFADAVARLFDHLAARAAYLLGAGVELGVSVLESAGLDGERTICGLRLLAILVTTCWPRAHAYMRDVLQATLRAALESQGHVSDDERHRILGETTTILHALHAANPGKLAALLAPARKSVTAVEELLVAASLPMHL
jgi:hypothetical protein